MRASRASDSVTQQSKLSKPRGLVPVTALKLNPAANHMEKSASAQRETPACRRVSEKLAEECATTGPLNDGPFTVLKSKTCSTLSVAVREGAKKRSEVIVDCLSSPDRLAECGLHIRRLLVIERSRSRSVAAVEGDCPLRYDLAGCRHERGSPSP